MYYLAPFGEFLIKTFIELDSIINAIEPSFVRNWGVCICKTNMDDRKIDKNRLEIYKIVIALFQINHKEGNSCLFRETLLLTDININIDYKMLFFILSNVEINFNN